MINQSATLLIPLSNGALTLPGPPPLPIIGNVHQLKPMIHKQFSDWARRYGPIFQVRVGNKVWVILNDHESIKDLFKTRGMIYSSRFKSHLISDVWSNNSKSLAFAPYGNWWNTMHSVFVLLSREENIDNLYQPIINHEARQFLRGIYQQAKNKIAIDPSDEIEILLFKIMLTIVYGKTSGLDSLKTQYQRIVNDVYDSLTTANLPDIFPWLRYLPMMTRLEKKISKLHCDRVNLDVKLLREVKSRMQKNGDISETCVASQILKNVKIDPYLTTSPYSHIFTKDKDGKYTFDEYDVYSLCANFIIGGTQSTLQSLRWFFAILATYPDVQQRVQDELDKVVGRGKLFTLKHEPHLHYLKATIKEAFRYRPTNLMGCAPHQVDRDDTYRGYHIPAKSVIVSNSYPIITSPLLFENPSKFKPERYLDRDGHLKPFDEIRESWIFGRGRRSCPGIDLANKNILTPLGYTLALFNFEVPKNPITGKNKSIDFEKGFQNSFDYRVEKYDLIFRPRRGIDIEAILQDR
ncbi:hypothetical protein G9A89_002333 [Geosiphon pyriformis]|nr:hypothetical protein G9A89_002333 [Geosiphon pyriformis]